MVYYKIPKKIKYYRTNWDKSTKHDREVNLNKIDTMVTELL